MFTNLNLKEKKQRLITCCFAVIIKYHIYSKLFFRHKQIVNQRWLYIFTRELFLETGLNNLND